MLSAENSRRFRFYIVLRRYLPKLIAKPMAFGLPIQFVPRIKRLFRGTSRCQAGLYFKSKVTM